MVVLGCDVVGIWASTADAEIIFLRSFNPTVRHNWWPGRLVVFPRFISDIVDSTIEGGVLHIDGFSSTQSLQ